MEGNVHEVVKLLAARMETHPEEFGPDGDGRWGTWLKQMEPLLTEEEKLMLRGPEMQDIHEEILDELLNGEQRRAEQKEKEMQLLHSITSGRQNPYANQAGAYQNAIGTIGTLPPAQPLNVSSDSIQLGNETLNEGFIKNVKKALGL